MLRYVLLPENGQYSFIGYVNFYFSQVVGICIISLFIQLIKNGAESQRHFYKTFIRNLIQLTSKVSSCCSGFG